MIFWTGFLAGIVSITVLEIICISIDVIIKKGNRK